MGWSGVELGCGGRESEREAHTHTRTRIKISWSVVM